MKILFLSAANSVHTVRWVNALASRGHDVHLVYNRGHEPKCDQINEKVHQHSLKYSGGIGYYLNAKELWKLTKKICPDIINAHYASGYGTLARVSRISPVLLSVWGSDVYDFPNQNKINKMILKKNVKYAQRIASTSNCMADELRRVSGIKNLKIDITPFGVDLKKYNLALAKDKNHDKIVIGTIKTLKPLYGIAEFIKSIHCLMDQLIKEGYLELAQRIQVEIYGDGPQKEELGHLIESLGMQDVIFLKGQIPNEDVPKTLSRFDVFCATSFKESFGVAVVEAMAMEVPVVVTDAEGFKEVTVDGECGYIVPRGDVEAIASKIKDLLLDDSSRMKIGESGRKRVEKLYDWNNNVDIMEEIYRGMTI